MKQNRGGALLEILLILGIFMSILPFIYNMVINKKENLQNAKFAKDISIVKNSLEQYVNENKEALIQNPLNIIRVKLSDLKNIPESIDDDNIELRAVKSKDTMGHSFVQGIVIFENGELSPLRTRQIARNAGEGTGFTSGAIVYGSFGTWSSEAWKIGAVPNKNSIISGTKTFGNNSGFLRRIPNDNISDSKMNSDIDMSSFDVLDAKNIYADSVKFLNNLLSDTIEAQRLSIANRIDFDSNMEVLGLVTVNGSISSDNRGLNSKNIYVSGKSQFRNIMSDFLTTDNLNLSGFSVGADETVPATLSIEKSLDMRQGHIQALDTYIEFSGSVAPKLIITKRIDDGTNSSYFWDIENGIANLYDITLGDLTKMAKTAYNTERTGKTGSEIIFGSVSQNANATAADFLKALDKMRKIVTDKYNTLPH